MELGWAAVPTLGDNLSSTLVGLHVWATETFLAKKHCWKYRDSSALPLSWEVALRPGPGSFFPMHLGGQSGKIIIYTTLPLRDVFTVLSCCIGDAGNWSGVSSHGH